MKIYLPANDTNTLLIGVSRGGGQGVLTPPFPGPPPLFICDPSLSPNPISQTNVMKIAS